MKLSTTTGLLSEACDDHLLIEGPEAVRRLREHGYEVLDFSFGFITYENYILRGEDWQNKVDAVAEAAAKYGVRFSQSHIPFLKVIPSMDPFLRNGGSMEYFEECVRRAYIASGMLGVRYATVHPLTAYESNYSVEASFQKTREYYDRYVELGVSVGVGTAFENMFVPFNRCVPIRYCSHYDDLINLVDSYHDDMVGICWDFGHANEMNLDQVAALRKIGHRLKNLHINDNSGTRDEHLLPFMGTVKWRSIIPILAEIGYDGDMTFETGAVTRKAVRALQDSYIRATYECGEYIMQLYEDALEKQKGAQ